MRLQKILYGILAVTVLSMLKISHGYTTHEDEGNFVLFAGVNNVSKAKRET